MGLSRFPAIRKAAVLSGMAMALGSIALLTLASGSAAPSMTGQTPNAQAATSWPDTADHSRDAPDEPLPGPILQPEAGARPNDLFVAGDASTPTQGIVAYDAPSTFVLRGIGITRQLAGQQTAVASYITASTEFSNSDLQFSPDGGSILFKNGNNLVGGTAYRLYLWDFQARRIKSVSDQNLAYQFAYWSPDSNFIAYVSGYSGGDIPREVIRQIGGVQLHIYNRRTDSSEVVARDCLTTSPVQGQSSNVTNLAWTTQDTLLFSKLPPHPPGIIRGRPDTYPNVYEVPARGGRASLVARDAYSAIPSPDGRWLAFFGWPGAARVDHRARNSATRGPGIYLFDRLKKRRVLVLPLTNSTSQSDERRLPLQSLHWTPDSHRLIVVATTYASTAAGDKQATLRVSVLPIPSQLPARASDVQALQQELKAVGSLQVPDLDPEFQVRFEPLSVSNDGSLLFIKSWKYVSGQDASPTTVASLQTMNLTTGQVSTLARWEGRGYWLFNFGWHEEASAPG